MPGAPAALSLAMLLQPPEGQNVSPCPVLAMWGECLACPRIGFWHDAVSHWNMHGSASCATRLSWSAVLCHSSGLQISLCMARPQAGRRCAATPPVCYAWASTRLGKGFPKALEGGPRFCHGGPPASSHACAIVCFAVSKCFPGLHVCLVHASTRRHFFQEVTTLRRKRGVVGVPGNARRPSRMALALLRGVRAGQPSLDFFRCSFILDMGNWHHL